MEIIYINQEATTTFTKPLSVAIGFFDGIHRGHLKLVKRAKSIAVKHNLASAMITFNPNPLVTLGVIKQERYLTSMEDRAQILAKLGIDYLIVIDFSIEVANMSPNDFINEYITKLNVKYVVCGYDFHFGAKGVGDANTLKQLANNQYSVDVISEVDHDDIKISSTRINQLLANGNIEEVNYLLSRPFRINGIVIHGQKNGRKLGYPTANIDYGSYALPRNGVYAVKVKHHNKTYVGMCNIGINPTINVLTEISMEVNIFDFKQEIYGDEIEVYFYDYIRDEKKFANLDELMTQLSLDKKKIAEYFDKI